MLLIKSSDFTCHTTYRKKYLATIQQEKSRTVNSALLEIQVNLFWAPKLTKNKK